MATDARRILIAGGGIGGLAAAVALRQRGFDAVVFERAPALVAVGAGISLWPNATHVLRELGLLERAEAWPLRGGRITTSRGKALLRMEGWAGGTPAFCFHRADLLDLLASALPPDALRLGRPAAGFAEDADGVRLRFEDGTEETGAALIGADGLRSRVRAALHGEAPPAYAGYTAWRGVVPMTYSGHAEGQATEAWGRGQRFGMVGLTGGRTYWFATANLPEGAAEAEPDPKAALRRRFAGWLDPIPALLEATPAEAVLVNDVYDRPPLRPWGRSRVTLLGDAAHPTTPNLGQGGGLALEDALVLARAAEAQPNDLPAAFRAYEGQRYRRTEAIVRQSRQIGAVAQWEASAAVALRTALARLYPRRLAALAAARPQRFRA